MYYFFNLSYNPLHFPQYPIPQMIYIDPFQNSITQNAILDGNTQQVFQESRQEKSLQKSQVELKLDNKNREIASNKKKNLISKKSKIKKMSFVDKRNIIPNNINHILAFVQRKSKSEKLVQKIIDKQRNLYDSYNAKGFYSYQTYVKNKLSVHVNTRALEIVTTHLEQNNQIFSQQEQLFYNKVCRIAIYYYLKTIAPLVTFNSQRLKNTYKLDHLKVHRFILTALQGFTDNEEASIEGDYYKK